MNDNPDSRKSGTFGGILFNCLKGVSDISAKFLHTVWNDEVLKDLKFACELELSDVVPAFKKHHSNLVQNYRPISLCQLSQRFLWELCLINLPPTWMNIYPLIFVNTGKVLTLKLLFLLLLRNENRS